MRSAAAVKGGTSHVQSDSKIPIMPSPAEISLFTNTTSAPRCGSDYVFDAALLLRPDRLRYREVGRIDRHRHTRLPLYDGEASIHAAAHLVELDQAAWIEFRWTAVHCSQRLRDSLAIRLAGLL